MDEIIFHAALSKEIRLLPLITKTGLNYNSNNLLLFPGDGVGDFAIRGVSLDSSVLSGRLRKKLPCLSIFIIFPGKLMHAFPVDHL